MAVITYWDLITLYNLGGSYKPTHQTFQVIMTKIEDVTAISMILDFCDFLSRFEYCNSTYDTFLESLGLWE